MTLSIGKAPFWIALLAFLATVGWMEYHILQSTNGAFTFPSDDAFIRLTIAKNLAFQKVWGISKYEFASASSSLLYPVLLAVAFFIFGAYPVVALAVNLAAGIALLLAVQRWLARQELPNSTQTLILLALVFLTPLPVIVVSGMEHTVQLLLCFLFITRFYKEYTTGQLSRLTYVYGALLVANRYEGIILIAAACILLAVKKKNAVNKSGPTAFKLAFFSLLPVLIFGVIALRKGSHFIPDPLLLRSGSPATAFISLYLAWLIGNAIIFGGALIAKYDQSLFKRAAVLFLGLLLAFNSFNAFQNISQASVNVYQQQYQAGQLLHRYYYRRTAALDNIGASSFFTEARDLDLSAHQPQFLDSLNKRFRPQVAICHDRSIFPQLLPHWTKIASWTIPGNVICKDPTLSIYAADTSTSVIKYLKEHLLEFQPHLPPDITVRYY